MTERRRSLPAGGQQHRLAMPDGAMLRVEVWPEGKRGRVLLLGGRGDFVEKYAESLHELVEAGFTVAAADWRGQGRSGRLGDHPMKGHAGDFSPWLADLGVLVAWLHAQQPGGWTAVAHSMGGHLLLRWLTEGGVGIDRAALLSPMLGLNVPPLGPGVTAALARTMVAIGRGGDWVAGGGPYVPAGAGSLRQRMLTSDADRYPDEAWWIASDSELGMGAPTWGWVAAAFASLRALTPAALARVVVPILILTPEQDGLVSVPATRRMAGLIPGARLETITGAGHELLRESDTIRARVLAALVDFLEDS